MKHIEVIVSEEERKNILLLLKRHIERDLPVLCTFLGYDVNESEKYKELERMVNDVIE